MRMEHVRIALNTMRTQQATGAALRSVACDIVRQRGETHIYIYIYTYITYLH